MLAPVPVILSTRRLGTSVKVRVFWQASKPSMWHSRCSSVEKEENPVRHDGVITWHPRKYRRRSR